MNVGGLWRTEVELEEEATWKDLKYKIEKVTGIWPFDQKLEPNGENCDKCELEEGDDVFCDWKLSDRSHPLHHAAYIGNIEAIRSWLASGADVNVTDDDGRTPLMHACSNSKEGSVVELLRLGANAQIKDNYDRTALHFVADFFIINVEKIETIVKILIKAGCNSAIRNKSNETFIDVLKSRGYEKLITKLEEWMKETKKE